MSNIEYRTSTDAPSHHLIPITAQDRRRQARQESGLRPVTIIARDGEQSFCIRNVSPRGAMGQTVMPVAVGDLVRLRLEDGGVAPARVRWIKGTRVGLQFIRPRSIQETLTAGPAPYRERDQRHRTARRAVVTAGDTYRVVNIGNVSRGGAQVEASLEPGFVVRVSIAGGPSLTCQVRWTRNGRSGLMFTRPVALDEFS